MIPGLFDSLTLKEREAPNPNPVVTNNGRGRPQLTAKARLTRRPWKHTTLINELIKGVDQPAKL